VARKISLPAAVGELAISFGALPFEVGAAKKAAADWFHIFLNRRNGLGDQEKIKAIERIKDHVGRYSDTSRFPDRYALPSYSPSQVDGYTWEKGGKKYVMIKTTVFNDLARSVNSKALEEDLDRRGYLEHNKNGLVRKSVSINNKTLWGYVFIPSAWEGEPDPTEVEENKPTIDELFE